MFSDVKQIVGCSTKEHPSRHYIQAHNQLFTESIDPYLKPLKSIEKGGGKCRDISTENNLNSNNECGYGICNKHHKCQCQDGYVGPNCKV